MTQRLLSCTERETHTDKLLSFFMRLPTPSETEFLRIFIVFAVLSVRAAALEQGAVDFVRDVRPLFQKHCVSCHGSEKQKGGLRLDMKSAAFKGGDDHGPSIVAGDATKSPLMIAIRGEREDFKMPPKGDRLRESEMAMIARWLDEGAVWPQEADLARESVPREHWAFRGLSHFEVPLPRSRGWARDPLDCFVLERLEREGLEPAPEAGRRAWLRRVSFDLTGLPPEPEQVSRFENDLSPGAYERVVDELLASPRHGEQWAQHWLDLVRYADTHGFEVNTERPNAWPYRDYVIRAMNADKPYNQFVREQIAGDFHGEDAATGFLVTASVLLPGQIGKDEASKRLARQDSLDEIVVNIGQTFMALSFGCARCHHHKFDPISSRDYYAMQSFFAGVEYQDREMQTPEASALRARALDLRGQIASIGRSLDALVPMAFSGASRPGVDALMNVDRFMPVLTRKVRFTIEATNSLEPCVDELEIFTQEGVNVALASLGARVTVSGEKLAPGRHESRFLNDGRFGNSNSWMSSERGKGWIEVEFAKEYAIERVVWSRDREGKLRDRLATSYRIEAETGVGQWCLVADASDRTRTSPANAENGARKTATFNEEGLTEDDRKRGRALLAQKQKLETELKQVVDSSKVFAGVFRAPDEIRVLHRGDPEQPKDPVFPAVPEFLGGLQLGVDCKEQDRRRSLADWIVSAENPLVARVIVNRLWQWHFGTGLVDTPSDFGRMGGRPTHPELLDWLAVEFIREGWSLKKLHRRIVLSATYRQSARMNAVAAAKDSEGRLLWRFAPRRLEAENIRDSMLAVSGQLNPEMFGRGFNLFHQRGGLSGFSPVEVFGPDNFRRMIYAHKVRREPDTVFGAFDCPDAGLSTSRRRESTTPVQALNLLNSRFTLEMSRHFSDRVHMECGPDLRGQVQRAYELALGRAPSEEEVLDALSVVEEQGVIVLCRALFNSNEFVFLP